MTDAANEALHEAKPAFVCRTPRDAGTTRSFFTLNALIIIMPHAALIRLIASSMVKRVLT
jgi:hypothetical protein